VPNEGPAEEAGITIHIDIVKRIISTTILPSTKFSIVIKKSEFLI
jgi:hypothetical protein